MAHKAMVQKLLQVRAHIIICLRAESKIDFVKDPKTGKTEAVPMVSPTGKDGWIPVCEKTFPFEMTASFLLTADKPGVPRVIKRQKQHEHLFPTDKPITEDSGRRIAEWAAGGTGKDPETDWAALIGEAATLADLGSLWQRIVKAKAHDEKMTAAKNARKAELEPTPAEVASPEVELLEEQIDEAATTELIEEIRERINQVMSRESKPMSKTAGVELLKRCDARLGEFARSEEDEDLQNLMDRDRE
jgi:hypothetical protein